jgi:dienelactone hydrolase
MTAAVLVAAAFVVLPVGIAVVATHRPRGTAVAPDLGRPALPVALHTSDGLALSASYVPSRTGAAVVVFPGRRTTTAHARMLVRRGFGVLVLDRRGEGGSQGDFNARGWGGEPDLRAALDFLAARPDVHRDRIGGLGLSVGGELLLQTAAHDARLKAVVADGAGVRSLAEQRHHPGIPAWRRPVSPFAVETLAGVILTGQGPPPDLVRLMPRIAPRPVLLVRALDGNEDEALNRAYRAAAPTSTQLWEVAGAGHTRALTAQPAAYERRVAGFLERALNG